MSKDETQETSIFEEENEGFPFESVMLIFNMQNETIRDFGNKANNLIVLTSVLLGLELNLISRAFESSNFYLFNEGELIFSNWLFLASILFLILSLLSSLYVMYSSTQVSPFEIGGAPTFRTTSKSENAWHTLGTLRNFMWNNHKKFIHIRRWSNLSFLFLVIGLLVETYVAIFAV
nr:hypothetical protein [uncultured Methanolobus sp.]